MLMHHSTRSSAASPPPQFAEDPSAILTLSRLRLQRCVSGSPPPVPQALHQEALPQCQYSRTSSEDQDGDQPRKAAAVDSPLLSSPPIMGLATLLSMAVKLTCSSLLPSPPPSPPQVIVADPKTDDSDYFCQQSPMLGRAAGSSPAVHRRSDSVDSACQSEHGHASKRPRPDAATADVPLRSAFRRVQVSTVSSALQPKSLRFCDESETIGVADEYDREADPVVRLKYAGVAEIMALRSLIKRQHALILAPAADGDLLPDPSDAESTCPACKTHHTKVPVNVVAAAAAGPAHCVPTLDAMEEMRL